MGLSYAFPVDLQRLSHARHAIYGWLWRRLDRYGLGREEPFLSMVSRRLRMKPPAPG